MAIAFVKDTSLNVNGISSVTAQTFTVSSTGGNTLAVTATTLKAGNNVITLTGVTDSAGNTWTMVPGTGDYSAASLKYQSCDGAFCVNAAAITTVTLNYSTTTAAGAGAVADIIEFSGVSSGAVLDGSNVVVQNTANTSFTLSVVTSGTSDIVLGVVACDYHFTASSNGFTLLADLTGSYNISSVPGTQTTATSGLSNNSCGKLTFAIGVPALAFPPALSLRQAVKRAAIH